MQTERHAINHSKQNSLKFISTLEIDIQISTAHNASERLSRPFDTRYISFFRDKSRHTIECRPRRWHDRGKHTTSVLINSVEFDADTVSLPGTNGERVVKASSMRVTPPHSIRPLNSANCPRHFLHP